MSDLVGNPEDRFSHNEAQMSKDFAGRASFQPRCEKTGLRGFRPDPTQTELYSHRIWLETGDFGIR